MPHTCREGGGDGTGVGDCEGDGVRGAQEVSLAKVQSCTLSLQVVFHCQSGDGGMEREQQGVLHTQHMATGNSMVRPLQEQWRRQSLWNREWD